MQIPEDLWYGNIEPAQQRKLLSLYVRKEETLLSLLNEEQKVVFQKATDISVRYHKNEVLSTPVPGASNAS